MLSKEEWLNRASRFDMGDSFEPGVNISIARRCQSDGSKLWVVLLGTAVLGKDKIFYLEPMASERNKEFIENTRFKSPEEAYTFYENNLEEIKEKYIKGI